MLIIEYNKLVLYETNFSFPCWGQSTAQYSHKNVCQARKENKIKWPGKEWMGVETGKKQQKHRPTQVKKN